MSTDHGLAERAGLPELAEIPDPFAEELASLDAAPAPAMPELSRLPPSPTRERLRARRIGLLVIAIGVVGAALVVLRLRGDLKGGASLAFVIALLGPLAAGALALSISVRGGRAGLGPSRRAQVGALGLAALSFVLTAMLGAWLAPHAPEPSWRADVVCATIGLLLAAAPLGLAIVGLRAAFPVVSRLRAALIGLASGALAAAALHAHCAHDAVGHVLFGHGFAMLACALVAAALARRLRA